MIKQSAVTRFIWVWFLSKKMTFRLIRLILVVFALCVVWWIYARIIGSIRILKKCRVLLILKENFSWCIFFLLHICFLLLVWNTDFIVIKFLIALIVIGYFSLEILIYVLISFLIFYTLIIGFPVVILFISLLIASGFIYIFKKMISDDPYWNSYFFEQLQLIPVLYFEDMVLFVLLIYIWLLLFTSNLYLSLFYGAKFQLIPTLRFKSVISIVLFLYIYFSVSWFLNTFLILFTYPLYFSISFIDKWKIIWHSFIIEIAENLNIVVSLLNWYPLFYILLKIFYFFILYILINLDFFKISDKKVYVISFIKLKYKLLLKWISNKFY